MEQEQLIGVSHRSALRLVAPPQHQVLEGTRRHKIEDRQVMEASVAWVNLLCMCVASERSTHTSITHTTQHIATHTWTRPMCTMRQLGKDARNLLDTKLHSADAGDTLTTSQLLCWLVHVAGMLICQKQIHNLFMSYVLQHCV